MADEVNQIYIGKWSQHRSEAGSPVTADPAISGSFPNRRGLLGTNGWKSILVGAVIGGGTTPTADVEVLLYDPDNDDFFVSEVISAVEPGEALEVSVFGQRVFLRLDALSGSPTSVDLYVSGATTEQTL